MVLVNYTTRELTAKLVYYGPGLCGKTTNLQYIYESLLPKDRRGKMVSLATETDRTLFFDFLPLELGTIRGLKTRVQLYTVPGQVHYNATRKIVLKGADAIVFVADSQPSARAANIESYKNMKANLAEHGIDLKTVPHVFQFNKRDLPGVMPIDQMVEDLNEYNVPFWEATAVEGIGVEDTLKGVVKLVMKSMAQRFTGELPKEEPAAAPAPARVAATAPELPPLSAALSAEPTRPLPEAPAPVPVLAVQAPAAPVEAAEILDVGDAMILEDEDIPPLPPAATPAAAPAADVFELEIPESVGGGDVDLEGSFAAGDTIMTPRPAAAETPAAAPLAFEEDFGTPAQSPFESDAFAAGDTIISTEGFGDLAAPARPEAAVPPALEPEPTELVVEVAPEEEGGAWGTSDLLAQELSGFGPEPALPAAPSPFAAEEALPLARPATAEAALAGSPPPLDLLASELAPFGAAPTPAPLEAEAPADLRVPVDLGAVAPGSQVLRVVEVPIDFTDPAGGRRRIVLVLRLTVDAR